MFIFYFIIHFVSASYHEQYRVPQTSTEKWESYIFNEREYIIRKLPVRWEYASIICRGRHNGSLAILDSIEKAEFLAEALSESQLSIDSVWVGARRQSAQDPEGYRWVAGSKIELRRTANDVMIYTDNVDAKIASMSQYPAWLNRTQVPVPESGPDCVALTRVYHDKPVFLDLPCEVNRPFVCEREIRTKIHVTEMKTVRCPPEVYHVFDGHVTWDQAAAHCVLGKMSLAHVSSMKCLKNLGITMLKARPSIESAWIGARGNLGTWTWIDDGTNILSGESNTNWPPVRDIKELKQNGCLQLDRHKTHTSIFLEARCDRKMSFICSEREEFTTAKNATPLSDENYIYILVKQKLFWNHAFDNCLKMNGVLASIEQPDVVTQLLLLMGENTDLPVGHIWVSGRLNMTKDIITDIITYEWYNPATGSRIPDKRHVRGGYIPPWLDDDYTTDNSCLNLDRENHLSGMVYGLPCDMPQYSICMIDKSSTDNSFIQKSENTMNASPSIINDI